MFLRMISKEWGWAFVNGAASIEVEDLFWSNWDGPAESFRVSQGLRWVAWEGPCRRLSRWRAEALGARGSRASAGGKRGCAHTGAPASHRGEPAGPPKTCFRRPRAWRRVPTAPTWTHSLGLCFLLTRLYPPIVRVLEKRRRIFLFRFRICPVPWRGSSPPPPCPAGCPVRSSEIKIQ